MVRRETLWPEPWLSTALVAFVIAAWKISKHALPRSILSPRRSFCSIAVTCIEQSMRSEYAVWPTIARRCNSFRLLGGSEEHTSELQSLMRITNAHLFCQQKINTKD